jgi:hypothetical protein
LGIPGHPQIFGNSVFSIPVCRGSRRFVKGFVDFFEKLKL